MNNVLPVAEDKNGPAARISQSSFRGTKIVPAEAVAPEDWPSRDALSGLLDLRRETDDGADVALKGLQELVGKANGSPTGEQLAAMLGTNVHYGLPSDIPDFDLRIARFGGNYFDEKPLTPYCVLLLEACKDNIIIALVIMASILLAIELSPLSHDPYGWAESIALYVSVLVIANVAAYIDYSKAKMFKELQAKLGESNTKFVFRGGELHELQDSDIVVGDIVNVNSHNASSIPADGILLQANNVKVDESPLTGEPEPISKSVEEDPFLFSGTTVQSGNGKLMVMAVGPHSFSGKIKMAVYSEEEEQEESPLTNKLDSLAVQIGKAGGIIATVCFGLMLFRGQILPAILGDERDPVRDILEYVVTAITILAVAVPEGLPLAVTLSLAFSSREMFKLSNLVKTLDSCETMGSATTICTDKTGTLTANRMTVRGCSIGSYLQRPEEVTNGGATNGNSAKSHTAGYIVKDSGVDKSVLEKLGMCVSCCTMNESGFTTDSNGKENFKGNPTDCALLVFGSHLGYHYETIRENTVGRSDATLAK
jgi:Ca2+ transporting ATPase